MIYVQLEAADPDPRIHAGFTVGPFVDVAAAAEWCATLSSVRPREDESDAEHEAIVEAMADGALPVVDWIPEVLPEFVPIDPPVPMPIPQPRQLGA